MDQTSGYVPRGDGRVSAVSSADKTHNGLLTYAPLASELPDGRGRSTERRRTGGELVSRAPTTVAVPEALEEHVTYTVRENTSSKLNKTDGRNYITYTRAAVTEFTMEESKLLEALHSHLKYLNQRLYDLELEFKKHSYEVMLDKVESLREKAGKLEGLLSKLKQSITRSLGHKVSEIEWYLMMLKQRFDNVCMLALSIECCDDSDEEMDFLNSLDYQPALELSDNKAMYALGMAV